eukprot:TRINITY_DN85530_c0_g1_i1.p2 TRINITY_DN85530_c0_g1~~TRINITY_DN85530_c0_g1_i1.p2  ORF type:complete len:171 (-),score=36.13 TRINITY_DN85530_c0_g1_i1:153-638(-)
MMARRRGTVLLAALVLAAVLSCRWYEDAFVTSGRLRGCRRLAQHRRAMIVDDVPDFLVDAAGQAGMNEEAKQLVPRLPEPWDTIVGYILTVFPFVVLASWAYLVYYAWNESKKATEEDDRRKLKRALKVDPKLMADTKKKKNKKKTALQEALELDEQLENR